MCVYLCICYAHAIVMFCIYSHLTFSLFFFFFCNLSSFQRITTLIVCQLTFNMRNIVLCALTIVFTVQQVCVLRPEILVFWGIASVQATRDATLIKWIDYNVNKYESAWKKLFNSDEIFYFHVHSYKVNIKLIYFIFSFWNNVD